MPFWKLYSNAGKGTITINNKQYIKILHKKVISTRVKKKEQGNKYWDCKIVMGYNFKLGDN